MTNGLNCTDKPFVPAGAATRLLARIIDELVALPCVILGGYVGYLVGSEQCDFVLVPRELIALGGAFFAYVVASIIYHDHLKVLDRQPFGKRFIGIKIVSSDGSPAKGIDIFDHWHNSYISLMYLGYGWLRVIWDPEKRALHDVWTNTRVVDCDQRDDSGL